MKSEDRIRELVEVARLARRWLDSDTFIEPDRYKIAARLARALRPFDDYVPTHRDDHAEWWKRQEARRLTAPEEKSNA